MESWRGIQVHARRQLLCGRDEDTRSTLLVWTSLTDSCDGFILCWFAGYTSRHCSHINLTYRQQVVRRSAAWKSCQLFKNWSDDQKTHKCSYFEDLAICKLAVAVIMLVRHLSEKGRQQFSKKFFISSHALWTPQHLHFNLKFFMKLAASCKL